MPPPPLQARLQRVSQGAGQRLDTLSQQFPVVKVRTDFVDYQGRALGYMQRHPEDSAFRQQYQTAVRQYRAAGS